MNSKGTILVVDDTPANLRLLVDILQADGHQVLPADSGELALASAAARAPDLILLDVRMPGLDGFEVCRRLKAGEATRDIPVLFISAATDPAERLEGFRLGAVDFLTKPIQTEELLARVGTHLELRRLRVRYQSQADDLRQANEDLGRDLGERRDAEKALQALNQQMQDTQLATLNLMDDALEARSRLEATVEALNAEMAERRRVQEELQEGALRYQTLVDHAPVAVFVNRNDRVALVNAACLQLFGATDSAQLLAGTCWNSSILTTML